MACKDCKYFDESEKWGSKYYCTYYKSYYYEDDSCSHYSEKSSSSSGCFLTSACCEFKGLPDDCYELTVLRNFRDNYLLKNDEGKSLINEYYQIAPKIVDEISLRNDKDDIYSMIYENIKKCIDLINCSKNDNAKETYIEMVNALLKK